MKRSLLMILCCLFSFAQAAEDRNLVRQPVAANGKRIALIIGNGDYRSADLKKLANPANDADDMASALRGFGFEVLAYKNLERRKMKDVIADFGRQAGNAEAALFYFAGHGIQIKGQNYLMPVDAVVRSEADVEDEGINVNYPLGEMEGARARVNLVVLDACRNNDFSGRFRSGGSRGLATPASIPKGTVVVYATDPGNVASDGTGRNGLFTEGMLAAFKGRDLSLDGVLTVASEVVEQKSGGKQTPYVNGPQTVKKNFYFLFQGPATVNVQPAPAATAEASAVAPTSGNNARTPGFSSFVFFNGNRFSDPASRREWRSAGDSFWAEIYPDGQSTRLTVLGQTVVSGAQGLHLRKQDSPDQEIFIPNGNSGSRKLMWRQAGGTWSYIGDILEPK